VAEEDGDSGVGGTIVEEQEGQEEGKRRLGCRQSPSLAS